MTFRHYIFAVVLCYAPVIPTGCETLTIHLLQPEVIQAEQDLGASFRELVATRKNELIGNLSNQFHKPVSDVIIREDGVVDIVFPPFIEEAGNTVLSNPPPIGSGLWGLGGWAIATGGALLAAARVRSDLKARQPVVVVPTQPK